MKNRFAVVIVDYYSIEETLNYIEHLLENTKDTDLLDFMIVDNAEDDSSLNKLKKSCDLREKRSICYHGKRIFVGDITFEGHKIYYLHSGINLGYARGNNLGIRFAAHYLKDKYAIVSNNDLKVLKPFSWKYFMERFEQNVSCAVIGPSIVDTNGTSQSPRERQSAWEYLFAAYWNILLCGRLFRFLHFFTEQQEWGPAYWVSGCFMALDIPRFAESGMFDERTFLFAEEMILSERLLEKGFEMFYTPDIRLLHNHSVTVNKKFTKLQMERIQFEAVLYYFQTYRGLGEITALLAKIHFGLFCILYVIRKVPQKVYHLVKDR